MNRDDLDRRLIRAATDLADRSHNPPWQIRERPVLLVNLDTLVKLGWEENDYILGMRVRLDYGTPPDMIFVTDIRTLNHEAVRVQD